LARIHSEVDEKGFSLLPAYLDDGFCAPVRRFIDDFDTARSEVNYGGSEKRVWMAHEKDAAIAGFRGFADELLSRIYGKEIISRDTLAIRNLPVEQTLELIKGRWHLDSLRTQVKVFAFLTEVTERSGPLEVIPGTHRLRFPGKFPQVPEAGRYLGRSYRQGLGRREALHLPCWNRGDSRYFGDPSCPALPRGQQVRAYKLL